MDTKPLISKWVAVGITLLFVGTCIIPATAQITEKPLLALEENCLKRKYSFEKTTYRLCHIQSGNVRHKGFDGWFFGNPVDHYEFGFCHLGFGSFTLVLQRDYFTDDNETTLKISHLTINEYNDTYIQIRVNLFIGYYQPTGGLGVGTLSGYALRVKILYKGDNP